MEDSGRCHTSPSSEPCLGGDSDDGNVIDTMLSYSGITDDESRCVQHGISISSSTVLYTVTDSVSTELASPAQGKTTTDHNQQGVVSGVVSINSRSQGQLSTTQEKDKKPQGLRYSEDMSVSLEESTQQPMLRDAPSETSDVGHSKSDRAVVKKKRGAKSSRESADECTHSTGRWTDAEHEAFLRGLHLFGREWKKVAAHIPTRTSAQVRSHAQKHFVKMQRDKDALLILSSARNFSAGDVQRLASSGIDRRLLPTEVAHGSLEAGLHPETQSTLDRILADPESVEAEVEETMQRLVRRYRQLQERLLRMEQEQDVGTAMVPLDLPSQRNERKRSAGDIENDTMVDLPPSAHGLQDEELIALSVLHASLPRSCAYLDGSSQESSEASSELETMDTNTSCCSRNMNFEEDDVADEKSNSAESRSSSKRRKSPDFSSV